MKIMQSHHIRIRDSNDYELNVEKFIKSIEAQYKFDFRSLPQWKKLLQRLHVMTTDCKRKIQDANLRKSLIIRKLFIEYTRPSPFELNDCFARTSRKWELLKQKNLERVVCSKTESEIKILPSEDMVDGSLLALDETPHPNTQTEPSQSQQTFATQLSDIHINLLPPHISTNHHKLISPCTSKDSQLYIKSVPIELEQKSEHYEWMNLESNKSVACSPKEIVLKHDCLQEQTIKFTLTNCSKEFLHLRFKHVTETVHFRWSNIIPETPSILYPGIPAIFKFVFKLVERKKEFTSQLFFKVSRKVYVNQAAEALVIPIVTKFIKARSVSVSESVYMPPIYFWNIKYPKYPSGFVTVSVNDDHFYHLHIIKRIVDLSKTSETSLSKSTETNVPSFVPEIEDKETESKANIVSHNNKTKSSKGDKENRKDKDVKESESVVVNIEHFKLIEDMAFIAKDIVELALDTFIFESTYLYLEPGSRKKIPVYLSKVENMGSHNCYYDFNLINPETEEIIITKITRVFADVLPHPIKIHPVILDMSVSHLIYGFCEDHFEMTNTHKVFPVTIKFRLSAIMKQMFRILPAEALLPALGSVVFEVKFCSRDRDAKSDDLIYFSFDIVVIGHKSIYSKAPPLIYEVIAPCVNEFMKTCHEKYYRDLMTDRAMKLV